MFENLNRDQEPNWSPDHHSHRVPWQTFQKMVHIDSVLQIPNYHYLRKEKERKVTQIENYLYLPVKPLASLPSQASNSELKLLVSICLIKS